MLPYWGSVLLQGSPTMDNIHMLWSLQCWLGILKLRHNGCLGSHSPVVRQPQRSCSMLQRVSSGNPSSVLQMDSMETQNNSVGRSRLIPMPWLERFPAAICIPATHSNLQGIKQARAGSQQRICAEISAWELDTIMVGTRSAGSSA